MIEKTKKTRKKEKFKKKKMEILKKDRLIMLEEKRKGRV